MTGSNIATIVGCIAIALMFLWGPISSWAKSNKEKWLNKLKKNKTSEETKEKEDDKKKTKKSEPTPAPWFERNKGVLITFLIAHIAIGYVVWSNGWYTDKYELVLKSSLFWINNIVLFLALTFFRDDKGSLKNTGTLIIVALGIMDIVQWVGWMTRSTSEVAVIRPTRYATPLPSNWHPTLLRPKEAEGKDTEAVRKFWDGHTHPNITVEEMVIICRNESGCNQRNDDGTVVRNHNENGAKDDVGVMQINEGWWAKEVIQQKALGIDLKDVDITTIKGNLDAALHLRTRYGLNPWTQRKFRESWIVEAPVGKWGDVVITPENRSMTCKPDPDTSVKVLVNGEREEIYVPGTPLNLGGGIMTKRFQSPDKKTVTILCSLE